MSQINTDYIDIQQYVWDTLDSNSWLIIENNSGLLVDAVENDDLCKTIMSLDGLTIILTHSHFDHVCGLNHIRQLRPDVKVIATQNCSFNIGNASKNLSSVANVFMSFHRGGTFDGNVDPFVCAPVDESFEGTKILEWQGHKIELDSVYGHSNDGLIMIIDDKYLFSGDTILDVPTITRFPGGSTKEYKEKDIPLLKSKKMRLIYPGHGRFITIGDRYEI